MKKKSLLNSSCATCSASTDKKACATVKGRSAPGCPTLTQTDVLEAANQHYEEPPIRAFARQASIQEGQCYANRHQRPYVMQPTKTRILEICEFAKKMSYKRLGLAFCLGLAREAAIVADILKTHEFEVISVLCKAGRTPKTFIDIKKEEQIFQDREEMMCNPIFQAEVLNRQQTELNIVLGLCVGHDSLFFKYSQAPATVLAVKDRVTGHNPLAAIYLSETYYRQLKTPTT